MMKHKNVINGCEYSDDGKILIRAALCYTSIVVPEGVEYIKEKAFYNVTTLQKIQLPSTILKIGARAFCGCRNLKEECCWDEVVQRFRQVIVILVDVFQEIVRPLSEICTCLLAASMHTVTIILILLSFTTYQLT